ncbi:hypothetical protein FG379_002423 [Cryptosporidium bovis]|uniref:uncharacterized protein n=1 Tax=Cryptosporidium bovis TaxID=310047 RepID=UPI003519EA8F|nr:hypothetical protein FG379_002423 [Cryptosporidium bovis]
MMKNNLLVLLCFYSIQLFAVKDSLLKNAYSVLSFEDNGIAIPLSLLKTRPCRLTKTRSSSSLLSKGFPGLNPDELFKESKLASSLKVKLDCIELEEIQAKFSSLFDLFLSVLDKFYTSEISVECVLELEDLVRRCKSKKRKHTEACVKILKAKEKVETVNRDYEILKSKMTIAAQTLAEIDELLLRLLIDCVGSFIEITKKEYDKITGSVGFVYRQASKLNNFLSVLNLVNKLYCHSTFHLIMRFDTQSGRKIKFSDTVTVKRIPKKVL